MSEMHDSGKRETYATGAERDPSPGKPRPELISPVLIDRIGQCLATGAEKYSPRNWERGIPLSRHVASLLRHLNAWQDGDRCAGGEDHLAALACNVMFLIHTEEMVRRGVLPAELDDMPRYRLPAKEEASRRDAENAETCLSCGRPSGGFYFQGLPQCYTCGGSATRLHRPQKAQKQSDPLLGVMSIADAKRAPGVKPATSDVTRSATATFQNEQRVQFLREPYWHLGQFIAYAHIDGREQCIIRTARTLGKPGHLHYCDPRDVRRAQFDEKGKPANNPTAACEGDTMAL